MKTNLFDVNGIEIEVGDKYTPAKHNYPIYTVFFKYGCVCGGMDEESAIPLGWEASEFSPDGLKPSGNNLSYLKLITTNEA